MFHFSRDPIFAALKLVYVNGIFFLFYTSAIKSRGIFLLSIRGGEMTVHSGGSAAIRGFRLQTFYILRRLLEGGGDSFQPEGAEDLLRLTPDRIPQEHVQIKAYSAPLTVSLLAKAAEGEGAEPPYLRRVLNRLSSTENVQETLVVIGTFGQQMRKAWQGDLREQEKIRRTLQDKDYSDVEIDLLFAKLKLEEINEAEQDRQIADYLQEGITAGDVQTARAVLAFWLLELSEQPKNGLPNIVSSEDVARKLQEIGRGTMELRSFHDEWGRTLSPLLADDLQISDQGTLSREFFDGVGAKVEHIIAGVDVRRAKPLEQLQEAFTRSSLVVVRGASGQGKTALALRFLHEQGLFPLSYQVRRLKDITHARKVAEAIRAFLRKHAVDLYLLVDVEPGDREWLELLRLSQGIRQLRILVTIRQEDWTKSEAELQKLDPTTISLKFDAEEAQPVFEELQAVRPSREFMHFQDAWNGFRQEGPLLEFVYMVTHEGQQLKARLQEQVEAIQQEWVSSPKYLEFMHAAAFAAAANAWVKAKPLATALGISAPELRVIVRHLSEEHLLREEHGVIKGLHAIRSTILIELLGDPDFMPAREAFQKAAPYVLERDLELLALHAFLQMPTDQVLSILKSVKPTTWLGLTGITRMLIWHSISRHVDEAKPAIQAAFEAFGFGWWILLSLDLLDLRDKDLLPESPDWDDLTFLSPVFRAKIGQCRAAFKDYPISFKEVEDWLRIQQQQLAAPGDVNDWLAVAELGFYSSIWTVSDLHWARLDIGPVSELALREASEVFYGLSFVPRGSLHQQLTGLKEILVERFKTEGNVQLLSEEDNAVKIHFIVPTEDALNTLPGDNPVHEATMVRLDILHFLFPDKEYFASQGHGHLNHLLPKQFLLDETQKRMRRSYFPPLWGVQWNRTFHRLADLDYLQPDWQAPQYLTG